MVDTDGGSRLDTSPDADGQESKAIPLLALDSTSLLSWFAGILASRAWVEIGLLADPLTGKVSKDLDQARLAIDALEGLTRTLKGKTSPDEARRLDAMLADLRLNYVRQAGPA